MIQWKKSNRKVIKMNQNLLFIKNGLIHDVVHTQPYIGSIISENGIIKAIGTNIKCPEASKIIDATNLHIYPGFVEAHCHLGLDGYGIGFEGQDYNEMNDSLTPHLRAIDAINPLDPTIHMAAKAGITCVATGPGSSNVLGGTFAAIKTSGKRIDDMIVKQAVAMKCAFGENPKRVYKNKDNYSRMSTAGKLREMLFKAIEYQEKLELSKSDPSKKPSFDMKLEALLPVLNHEIPLKAHAHRADDIFTAIRIAKEFQLNLTLEHGTEGHLIAEDLAKEGYPIAVGPSFGHATKFELRNKTFETPGILAKAGCQVSIITDSPVIPQHYLPLCAGLAVKSGMDELEALKAITINPAKHLGISDRVGSLELGKDADIVITDGNPLHLATNVIHTIINGKMVEE